MVVLGVILQPTHLQRLTEVNYADHMFHFIKSRSGLTCQLHHNTICRIPDDSHAGYWGALVLVAWLVADVFFHVNFHVSAWVGGVPALLLPLVFGFYVMVLHEMPRCRALRMPTSQLDSRWRWRSAFLRFLVVFAAISITTALVHSHYYFLGNAFHFTRDFYFSIWCLVLLFGLPYMLVTLRYRGESVLDFNDFSIVLLAGGRALKRWLAAKLHGRSSARHLASLKNRRLRKMLLVYLVNAFFLTLMTRFFAQQWADASLDFKQILQDLHGKIFYFDFFSRIHLLLIHVFLTIDTGLAIIAYTVSTRWLGNRVQSIDMTASGWAAALLCYPPFNDALSQFIGYGRFETTHWLTWDWAKMLVMTLVLVCMGVYVWATMALGFKFGNLVNRGIVSSGPYRYLRHPAYAAKNLSWWLDNTHVLTNPAASLALLAWNMVYWWRGTTEEHHLLRDAGYRRYSESTRTRFLPRLSITTGQ